jgi:hypothetical protein
MVRAVDEDADAGGRIPSIVKVRLDECAGRRRVLGEIGKAQLLLVEVAEEGALERGRWICPLT